MAASLPILTFHTLDDRDSVISFPPALFRHGLLRLQQNGYRTLDLMDAVKCLYHDQPFPERAFVMTFDDGYKSVFDAAFPILQQFGMTATVFLTVGEKKNPLHTDRLPTMAERPMLSWEEIKEMLRYGVTFGAHTLTHSDLTLIPGDRAQIEICESKAVMEAALGVPVRCFAYPYGRYDSRSRDIVQQNFACACSDKLALITRRSNPYTLERVDAYYLRTERLFEAMVSRFFPWYITARNIPRTIRRAIRY